MTPRRRSKVLAEKWTSVPLSNRQLLNVLEDAEFSALSMIGGNVMMSGSAVYAMARELVNRRAKDHKRAKARRKR